MKIIPNKKYNTIALYAFLVIAANLLLLVAVFKFSSITRMLKTFLSVLTPVTWGLVMAFLMNPIMVKFENLFKNKVVKNPAKKRLTRACSVIVASIVFLGIVIGCISVVLPELINSIMDIFNNASTIAANVQDWINRLLKNYPAYAKKATEMLNNFSTDVTGIIEKIQPMLENILSGAWSVITIVKNFALGFIVSIYMLCSKETLLAQIKKMIISITKKSTCEKIMRIASQSNKIFAGFISGKIVDSIIIGLLCFVGLTIMNMPYNIMISVIIGITNVIPFFGPFFGAIPSALLILLVEPRKVILFLIFILCLQQFDGNILGPKILGDSTGLPGFWVLVSLLIGGGLFGFVGMLLAVPVCALLYAFTRQYVESKLRKRKLPVATEYYMEDVEHLYAKPKKRTPMTPEQLKEMKIPPADEVNEALIDN
ncbi:MAG: AI-2E family transporter [Hominimerdicola sp.]